MSRKTSFYYQLNLFFKNLCFFAPFNKNTMLDNFVNYYVLHFLDDKKSFKKLLLNLKEEDTKHVRNFYN